MNIPCNIPCQQCTPFIGGASSPSDPDYPFVNLSSEAPDVDNFIGKRFGPPPGDPGGGPPLGNVFYAIGCLGWCVSAVSQEDADLCAAQQELECLANNWPQTPNNPPPILPPPSFPPPTFPPAPIFANDAQSCSFTCPDGSAFSYTVEAGKFFAFNKVAANVTAKSYACNKAIELRLCVGTLTPALWCAGQAYNGSITASSALPPLTFNVVGDLPDGLVATGDPTTLFLTGTVNIPGDYTFAVQVIDDQGHTVNKDCAVTFFGIVTDSSLPQATEGQAYLLTLVTGGTVTDVVTYSLSGVIPAGMTFNTDTGTLSGTPSTGTNGEYNFTITAIADGLSCPKNFFMTVAEATTCPDWAHLLWQTPAYFTQDGGFASFTPDSVEGAVFNGIVQVTGVFESQAAANNIGEISYNGPGCQCKLHVDLTNPLPGAAGFNSAILRVTDETVFAFLVDIDVINDASGGYDYLFVLPDTGGVPHTIRVTVQLARYYLAGATNTIVQGTLSNV